MASKLKLESRHHIYSYIGLTEYITKIARLSRKEREQLKDSAVASAGKVFEFPLFGYEKRHCILHEKRLEKGMQRLKTILSFVSAIRIPVALSNNQC